MPPPAPPVALKGHCSVIHDNVLYVYSPDALQSLPLQKDAQWSQEPMGISVTGAGCVLGGVDGDHSKPALYIVGGSLNSSSLQYPGLQRYSLQDKRWKTINLLTPITQNRKHHGTAFLNASSSILVYAGSQDGDSNPSTQTFLVETWPPYNVRSFSSPAPPVVDPIMLTWGDNRAAMIGGSPTNNHVFTLGPDDGWADAGVVLTQPPPNRSIAQSALLSLADESKVLVTFDMSKSPNTVTRTVVLNPGGRQAQFGETVGDSGRPSRLGRRDVTLSTFPNYNDSLAPKTVRVGASLAQGPGGLTVISGGNDQDPLSIFDALRNQWIDATELIGGQSQTPLSGSPTSSVSISTASATSTSAPTGGGARSRPLTILGAVLGSICGIAAVLIIALLLLRWKKHKRSLARRNSNLNGKKHKDDQLSFEDQGMQPFRAAAEPMGRSVAPSTNDLTLIGGPVSHTRNSLSTSSRRKFDPQRSSHLSFGPGMFSRNKAPLVISQPIPREQPAELQDRPRTGGVRSPRAATLLNPSGSRRTDDSGWSTYFSGDTAVNMNENHNITDSRDPRTSPGLRGSYWPDPAAPVAKLRTVIPGLTDDNGNQLAKKIVPKGSPSMRHGSFEVEDHGTAVTEGIPAKTFNTDSVAAAITDGYDPRRAVDSNMNVGSAYPSNQHTSDYDWAFQDSSWSGPPRGYDRPPSSTYTNSVCPPNATTSRGEDWSKSSIRPVTQWPNETTAFPIVPNPEPGTSRGPNPPARPPRPGDQVRDYFGANYGHERSQSDMSWLNLNGNGYSKADGNG